MGRQGTALVSPGLPAVVVAETSPGTGHAILRALEDRMWTLLLGWALAQDAITFTARNTVQEGEVPSVTFRSIVEGQLTVSLSCGGRSFSLKTDVHPGSEHELALKGLPGGSHGCGGTVRLDQPDGSWGEMPLNVPVSVLSPLTWQFGMEDVDLGARTLVAHPNRPLKEAQLQLIGLGRQTLGHGRVDLSDPSHPRFTWDDVGEVLVLRIEGADQKGIAGFLELSPWSYEVPHDDVVFASGSHAIPGGETGKLESCWSDVQAVLAKYGDVVDIELFVAGYTDTVGASGSNQALSQRRAQSIAAWFRQRGFRGPIWYQGFGESVLAVGTPDETDEAANRRAVYVLSADTPPVSDLLPRQAWTRL